MLVTEICPISGKSSASQPDVSSPISPDFVRLIVVVVELSLERPIPSMTFDYLPKFRTPSVPLQYGITVGYDSLISFLTLILICCDTLLLYLVLLEV